MMKILLDLVGALLARSAAAAAAAALRCCAAETAAITSARRDPAAAAAAAPLPPLGWFFGRSVVFEQCTPLPPPPMPPAGLHWSLSALPSPEAFSGVVGQWW